MSDRYSSAPWVVSQIDQRLGNDQTQALCVAASAFDIDRQELEKARDTRSLSTLYSLLKTKIGSHGQALSVIIWMLERTGYSDLTDLSGCSEYEPIDNDQLARKFRSVDFLLTVISVFRAIPEEQYRRLRAVVAGTYLDGLSHDRIENRASLVQRMYDKGLIREDDCEMLYQLLERHGLNRYCGMLNEYFDKHSASPQGNSQGRNCSGIATVW